MEARVFHSDLSNVRDVDNICTKEDMKCLTKYALHPKFIDFAINVILWMTKKHLDRLERTFDAFSKTCSWFNLKYDVNQSLEG